METMEWELCRLLIDCLRKNELAFDATRLSRLSPERWEALLTLATTQRVVSLLWQRLRQKGLDKTVPVGVTEVLREASRRNTLHNLLFYGELRLLLSALKPEGIPLILLKGIFLADAVYGNIGLREMNDIDVLARHADLTRIAKMLTSMGYSPLQPICADITLDVHQHLPRMVKPDHASFEIHWNLTSPGENYSIDPGGLWERAMPVQVAGCETLSLAPEDLLLHLCVHTSYHHQFEFGLRPSCDIAETISHFGSALDWQTVAERAAGQGWQRGAYLALRLAKELAGADVPADILARLRPTDITETVLETARAQVFADKSLAIPLTLPLAELLESRRLPDKIRIFWQRIFLPRAMIAAQYAVPMDSARIYSCYLRRFLYLLRRYGHTLKEFQGNDSPLKALVNRKNLIANWLTRPATASESRMQQHNS